MNFQPILAPDIHPPLWIPKLLDKPSTWWGHVPFAFWVTAACNPRVVVELGTHYGVSYAAFCEAILRLGLNTRSYAVDSWVGDPQAGFYGDEVYSELVSFNYGNYSSFSELLRMPFDEATQRFTDGTIDILHIDGYHTYEAVAHDFNIWRPKLSNRGVVLFHDTNVRRDDFGVWRFFEELSRTVPCFEFLHGFGLGVACVGADAPAVVQELCGLDNDAVAAIRERFSQSGAVWVSANEALIVRQKPLERVHELECALDEKMQAVGKLEARLDEGRRELDATLERLSLTAQELATLREHAKTESERVEAESKAAAARADRLANAEREATAQVSRLNEDRDFLARNLARTYHRPLRPIRHHLTFNLLRSLSVISAPVSSKTALRFARSAQKRNPKRFDLYLSKRTDPPDSIALISNSTERPLPAPNPISIPSFTELLRSRFLSLEPLRVYEAPHHGPRVTLVTDSINKGSLYGGVATAIILAVLIARRLGADLRLVTREEPPDAAAIAMVLRTHGVSWDGNVECLYSPPGQGGRDIPMDREDLFVTTSWWTTRATRGAVPPNRIVYMLGEDERLFYPTGDDYILCAETLSDPEVFYAVNSSILFDHLKANGFAPGGVAFEPAFSKDVYYPEKQSQKSERRQFFFYGRPHNSRNLYWRGVSAIAAAIEEGILEPEKWDFCFVGKDMQEVVLPRGVRPQIMNDAPRAEYIKLVRRVDVGLSLIYTPHPSYPPFDLAASGAVVVTNRFGSSKIDLSRYSPNILCVEPSLASLVEGLRTAVALAEDRDVRFGNVSRFAMPRDWETAFSSVVELVADRFLRG